MNEVQEMILRRAMQKVAHGMEKEANIWKEPVSKIGGVAVNGIKSLGKKVGKFFKGQADDIAEAGKDAAKHRVKQIKDTVTPALEYVDDTANKVKNKVKNKVTDKIGDITGKNADDWFKYAEELDKQVIAGKNGMAYLKKELLRQYLGAKKVGKKIAELTEAVAQGKIDKEVAAKQIASLQQSLANNESIISGLTGKLQSAGVKIAGLEDDVFRLGKDLEGANRKGGLLGNLYDWAAKDRDIYKGKWQRAAKDLEGANQRAGIFENLFNTEKANFANFRGKASKQLADQVKRTLFMKRLAIGGTGAGLATGGGIGYYAGSRRNAE